MASRSAEWSRCQVKITPSKNLATRRSVSGACGDPVSRTASPEASDSPSGPGTCWAAPSSSTCTARANGPDGVAHREPRGQRLTERTGDMLGGTVVEHLHRPGEQARARD